MFPRCWAGLCHVVSVGLIKALGLPVAEADS